ncbi:putative p-loop containing nucleoside triphosphate hydrolase [Golovinomyces cichoracearum]|uniref:Putative p-loop containing nucleoside triphosphate hydrolase n=1 Tax=Golovinomyces cichoracearum TaxID=62708 RepID=A0A420HJ45_9PEZI|nr:putative p-loop containing nucleoside triphosphate hydrolase [Golovinomyces cichoracearum]
MFFCPRLVRILSLKNSRCPQRFLCSSRHRLQGDSTSISPPSRDTPEFNIWALGKLPRQCPGCGAPSQIINKQGPGFYDLRRHAIRKYLGLTKSNSKRDYQDIVRIALQKSASLNLDPEAFGVPQTPHPVYDKEVVKCCRCRNLLNHRIGIPIEHPSIDSIRDTIDETSYKYNHIYHVIDAADFPMSVIPGLQSVLNIAPLRSKNRRAKTGKFYNNRITEISFVITRSDLLAPLKEQVDSMMPYLQLTLRDALGRSADGARLGNIHCVSVKRDWWTKELKENVWSRGGAGWMIGKLNVGKSKLFGSIFPKGRKFSVMDEEHLSSPTAKSSLQNLEGDVDENTNIKKDYRDENTKEVNEEVPDNIEQTPEKQISKNTNHQDSEISDMSVETFDPDSLLPPAPPELNYPTMPIVSDLPGTTASPIRLTFGNGKGELIDLPGLKRGDLDSHIKSEYQSTLVMTSRVEPIQDSIKPGQSLLLGGFIRITPTNPDITILAYAFTSIESHLTSTLKAIGTQTETRDSAVLNIALPGTGSKIASAGKFLLKWDVTKQRTGPVTARDAGRVNVEKLPYLVIATDILVEGCGWVELVAQVSKRNGDSIIKPLSLDSEDKEITQEVENQETGEVWPGVEVFTPHGKYISARRPMNAWSFISKKQGRIEARPRRPVAGHNKKKK